MYLSQEKTKETSQNSHILKNVNFQWLLGFLFLDGCIQCKFWLQNANLPVWILWIDTSHTYTLKKKFPTFYMKIKILTQKILGKASFIFFKTFCQFVYRGKKTIHLVGIQIGGENYFSVHPINLFILGSVYLLIPKISISTPSHHMIILVQLLFI